MFIVFLRFSDNRSNAVQFMDEHNQWIQQGFEDGVFLAVGSLKPAGGGGILAFQTTLEDLEKRVSQDPFVAQNIVTAEIHEIAVAKANEQLRFLI